MITLMDRYFSHEQALPTTYICLPPATASQQQKGNFLRINFPLKFELCQLSQVWEGD